LDSNQVAKASDAARVLKLNTASFSEARNRYTASMPCKSRSRNEVGGAAALGDLPAAAAGTVAFLVAVAMILHLPRRESFRARTGRAGVGPFRFSEATKLFYPWQQSGTRRAGPNRRPNVLKQLQLVEFFRRQKRANLSTFFAASPGHSWRPGPRLILAAAGLFDNMQTRRTCASDDHRPGTAPWLDLVPEDFVAADAGGVQLSSRTQQGSPIADPGRPAKIKRRQAHLRRVEEPEFGASAWVLIGGLLGNPLGLTSESLDLFALPGNLALPKRLLEPRFKVHRFPRGIAE